MRPLYETEADRDRAWSAICELSMLRGRTPFKMPKRYAVDYALMDGTQITAWAEVKVRDVEMGQYSDLMISAGKLMSGVRLSEATGVPFLLVVRWRDALAVLHVTDTKDFDVGVGGRVDRNDPQDVEPVFNVDLNRFAIVDSGVA